MSLRPIPRPQPIRLVLLMACALALALTATAAAGQTSKVVAKDAKVESLGRTVLTRTNGHTLYSLSVETHGRFVCTGACLGTWTPLTLPRGIKPKGPVKLGTVVRPNGKTQVTFKGRPLYSFNGDTKTGEANGEGFKDVGTWHAAAVAQTGTPPAPEGEPTPYPY